MAPARENITDVHGLHLPDVTQRPRDSHGLLVQAALSSVRSEVPNDSVSNKSGLWLAVWLPAAATSEL
jgi:hypothetical protein